MIEKIMTVKYGSDNPKYDASNRAFLESLSTPELEKMVWSIDHEETEDEVELEGEIHDVDDNIF